MTTTKAKPVEKKLAAKKGKKEAVTLINFLLDKSGSMGSVLDTTISGFNEYLQTQQAEPGKTLFSLTTFDTQFQSVHVAKPITEVAPLNRGTYRPGGMTALYDALAETLTRVEDRVTAAGKDKADVVLFVVMTDGEENASHEYTADSIKPMVERAEKELGYTFVFLGANQNVWAAGSKMGIGKGNILDYSGAYKSGNLDGTFQNLSQSTTRLRSVAVDCLLSGDDTAYQATRQAFWDGDKKKGGPKK